MSAYIVTPRTIKAMVQYLGSDLQTYHKLSEDEAAELLYDENRKSVSHRYDEKYACTDKGIFLQEIKGKGWEYITFPHGKPVDMIKIVHCWQYQTCEHPGHETSKAWGLSKAIINKAIGALPGYEEAPWGLDDPEPAEIISLHLLSKKINKRG